MKKIFKIISICLICFIATIKLTSYAETNNSGISVEQISLSSSGLIIKVSSNSLNINSVEIYKKATNNQYSKFYKLINSSFKEKTLYISHHQLSKNNPTNLKIIITDENNKIHEFFLNADKLPEKTSPLPSATVSSSPSPSATVKPTTSTSPSEYSIKLNKTSLSLDISSNSTSTLIATVKPSNAKVTWNSSNTNVATVNSSGKITAKSAGNTVITATITDNNKRNLTANCKVTVSNIPASITLDRTVLMIDTTHYNYANLVAKTTPENSKVTWNSSNTSIATVNSKGHVVGKAFGTTTITASIKSNGKTLKATCKVRVITQPSTSKKVSINVNLKPSKAEIESYINNAEKICNTTTNYTKYTEASGGKRPYYTGSSPNWGTRKFYTQKQGTISKTNYLSLAFSVNQRVYLLQKKAGSWHLIATDRCTTGPISNKYHYTEPKHNRFDFYIGCYSPMNGYTGNVLFQFYDVGKSGYYLQQRNGNNLNSYKEPFYTHRAMHIGPKIDPNGKPISAGCVRLTPSFYSKLNPIITKNLGTRLIVF